MKTLPANRTAALGGTIAAVVGAVTAVLGAVPDSWKGPVLMAAMVCGTAIILMFLRGSQRDEDRRQALEDSVDSIPLEDVDQPPAILDRPDVPQGDAL